MLETVVAWLRLHAGLETELQWRLVLSTAALAGLVLLRILLLRLLRWRINGDDLHYYHWRKGVEISFFLMGSLLLARLWLTATAGAATYLGLITAGLTIALQDPLTNLVGWLFLVWRRPFSVGDRIQVGNQAGDVIDIRFFQFTLMEIREWVDADQSTGRILHLPNRRVFSESIANFTRGFAYIWNELTLEVTFESDWRRAKGVLQEIAERHSLHLSDVAHAKLQQVADQYLVNYQHLTPIVYVKVNACGVQLTVRYLTDPRQRRTSAGLIWEEILDTFAQFESIQLAYPTQRHIVEFDETILQHTGEKGRRKLLLDLFSRPSVTS